MENYAPAPRPQQPTNHPKFVRWAVVLGIIIVLNVFFTVIRSIAFPSPVYNDFCPLSSQPPPTTETACTKGDGIWYAPNAAVKGQPEIVGYCDTNTKCQKPFENAQKAYEQKAFGLMIALGVISLVIGILPIGSSIVSAGLSYGGVLALIIGSASYWSEAGNWLKLAISFIALAVLLYIGMKRFRD
jgi:hypothetical protein